MKKFSIIKLTFLVLICVCGGLIVWFLGLIDYIPVLRASAQSPDNKFIVMIYQQRLFPRPIFPRMGAFAKVYDEKGNLVYNEIIYHDDNWDDTVGEAYKHISFVENEIHIGPGAYIPENKFIIKNSDFKIHQ